MISATLAPPRHPWEPLIERALAEDLGSGDVTSRSLIPADAHGRARLEAREPVIVCGLAIAEACFEAVDSDLVFEALAEDGARLSAGQPLARVEGQLASILAAERTALNFLQRMSGIASLTHHCVEQVKGTRAQILDTRKTLPGWRVLDKYAVATGGGSNHRMGLFDGILVKDNHIAAAGGVEAATKAVLAHAPPHLHVQIEVESLEDAHIAIQHGACSLLLDNLGVDELRRIVEHVGDEVLLEASGGITVSDLRAVAATGVHRISIGALTHSAPAADLALEIEAGDSGS